MNEYDKKRTNGKSPFEQDPFAHSFKQGDFAAAYLSHKWSRCLVLEIEHQRAFVECVDTCERQYVHLSKLEKLVAVFKKLPRYAFRCQLSDWATQEMCLVDVKRFEAFRDWLAQCKPNAHVEIHEFKESNLSMVYEVRLFVNGVDFAEQFTKFTK